MEAFADVTKLVEAFVSVLLCRGFKSGLRSPAIPDEAVIKQATQLSVSETIKLLSFRTCEWEDLSLLVSPSFNLAVAEPLTDSLVFWVNFPL